MEYQFWVTQFVTITFGLIAAYGVYLQHASRPPKGLSGTTNSQQPTPNSSAPSGPQFTRLLWLMLLVLALTNWMPYTLSRTSGRRVTPSNIEQHVKDWVAYFNLPIQKTDDKETFFNYSVLLRDGVVVNVYRTKERDRYIMFGSSVSITAPHPAIMASMTTAELEEVTDHVLLELARAKVGYAFIGQPIKQIVITRSFPIGDDLTESSFSERLDEVDSGTVIARESLRLALNPYKGRVPSESKPRAAY